MAPWPALTGLVQCVASPVVLLERGRLPGSDVMACDEEGSNVAHQGLGAVGRAALRFGLQGIRSPLEVNLRKAAVHYSEPLCKRPHDFEGEIRRLAH